MKLQKIIIIFLTIIFVALAAFNFLVILPEYCACKDASENATVLTIYGSIGCIGDSAEFSLIFFKMISFILIILLLVIITFIIFYRTKERVFNKTT